MDYKPPEELTRKVLTRVGLTKQQAQLYEALMQYGELTATRAAFLSNTPRTLSYKVLHELQTLDLVVKNDKRGEVALFKATNIENLHKFAGKRLNEAVEAKNELESVLGISKDKQKELLKEIHRLTAGF